MVGLSYGAEHLVAPKTQPTIVPVVLLSLILSLYMLAVTLMDVILCVTLII